ncbi:MAG: hypothetical protein EAZ92_12750 [Candidatus Kapaibacterium sp.]|nr:MAG: hypothetical protein EAZ92_12750 [Candidatus Kapabacteria bacterium]
MLFWYNKLSDMTSNTFDILCIEPKRIYALSLKRDLQREHVLFSNFSHTAVLEEASEIIRKTPPHLVFLSINFPMAELTKFLEVFSPRTRSFALIFVESTPEHIHKMRPTLHQQTQRANFSTQHQAGYLFVGGFGNKMLVDAVNTAREWLQHHLHSRQKEELARSLEQYLSHPYIIAQQRMLPEKQNTSERAQKLYVLNNELRYPLNHEEELRISFDRIVHIEGDNKYCWLHFFDEEIGLTKRHLLKKIVLEQLDEHIFVHTHQSHWVNIAYIRSFAAETVELLTGKVVPCSRRERPNVEAMIRTTSPQLFAALLLKNSLPEISTSLQKSGFWDIRAEESHAKNMSIKRPKA